MRDVLQRVGGFVFVALIAAIAVAAVRVFGGPLFLGLLLGIALILAVAGTLDGQVSETAADAAMPGPPL